MPGAERGSASGTPVPGALLGAWRIERELGRGGMGVVFLASRADGAYAQQVAIKWLPLALAAGRASQAFRRERQLLADLRHPHIARLVDGGTSAGGHLWFAMEYVDGPPLDRYCAEHALTTAARVRLLLPVVEAVDFAHKRLLAHRDIKPGNVLVGSDGHAMLLDFGVAALLGERAARHAVSHGHASPEQRAGAAPAIAADVWQLGRLLETALLAGPQDGTVPAPPPDLAAVIARACADQPEARYVSAAALKRELLRWLEHRPVAARPATPWHRLGLLARRHPWGMAGSALAGLAFVAVVAGFMLRLAHQRDAAERARAQAEAINTFIDEDLLSGADPLQAGSNDQGMASLVERALARVEPRLGADPEVAARVEVGLGRTLANLGRRESADVAFGRAIAHLAALHGTHDERVYALRLQREQQRLKSGEIAPAEQALKTLRQDIAARLGATSPLLLEADVRLAGARLERGDFAGCITLYQALLPRFGPDTPVLEAESLMDLSLCESRLGHFQAALTHANASLRLVRDALGDTHPYTLESSIAVENALVGLGRYEQAVKLLKRLVDAFERRYGDTHPVTLLAMHDLGFALTCGQRADEAVPWLHRAAAGRRQTLGADHPWYALTEGMLGTAEIQRGQLAAAEAALHDAREAFGQRQQALPFIEAMLQQNEADLALARGRTAEAVAYYVSARAITAKLYGADSQRVAVIDVGLGLAELDAGQAASTRLTAALARIGTHPDCRSTLIARARQRLAAAGNTP